MTLIRMLLLIACALAAWQPAHALQILDGAEGKKHVVRIPAREMTRIAIEQGRLQSMRYVTEELEVQQDKENGQVYVKPRTSEKQISVFVISSSGATHELILQPVETMPLESIVIKDPVAKRIAKGREASAQDRASPLDQAVKRLMLVMARKETDAPDAAFEKLEVPMTLWHGVSFVLTGRYSSYGMVGEVYRLSNVSQSVIRLAEQELFKAGVKAVAIDQLMLKPGEATDVYVIRVSRGDE